MDNMAEVGLPVGAAEFVVDGVQSVEEPTILSGIADVKSEASDAQPGSVDSDKESFIADEPSVVGEPVDIEEPGEKANAESLMDRVNDLGERKKIYTCLMAAKERITTEKANGSFNAELIEVIDKAIGYGTDTFDDFNNLSSDTVVSLLTALRELKKNNPDDEEIKFITDGIESQVVVIGKDENGQEKKYALSDFEKLDEAKKKEVEDRGFEYALEIPEETQETEESEKREGRVSEEDKIINDYLPQLLMNIAEAKAAGKDVVDLEKLYGKLLVAQNANGELGPIFKALALKDLKGFGIGVDDVIIARVGKKSFDAQVKFIEYCESKGLSGEDVKKLFDQLGAKGIEAVAAKFGGDLSKLEDLGGLVFGANVDQEVIDKLLDSYLTKEEKEEYLKKYGSMFGIVLLLILASTAVSVPSNFAKDIAA